jgi:hypothetical protein
MIDEGEEWDVHRRTRSHRRLAGKKEGTMRIVASQLADTCEDPQVDGLNEVFKQW